MASRNQRILMVVSFALLVTLVALPLIAGTSTYPLAIVQGNSMYPKLQNGELVFFTAQRGPIANSTIIVFVQSASGVPALDSFLKPVVIHRVVGTGLEPSGVTYYQTKGDNNISPDPFVTDSTNVLGVSAVEIPYVGLPILFLQTPYGLVAAVALVCIFFLSSVDTKLEDENERKRLIAVFARYSLNGKISPSQFERLRLSVEFFNEIPVDQLNDPTTISVIDWLKEGNLREPWKEEQTRCPTCGTVSLKIESGSRFFLICPICSDRHTLPNRTA
jgi:signal peptidase I